MIYIAQTSNNEAPTNAPTFPSLVYCTHKVSTYAFFDYIDEQCVDETQFYSRTISMEYNAGNPLYPPEMIVTKIRYIMSNAYEYRLDRYGNCNYTNGFYPCDFSPLGCMTQWGRNVTYQGVKYLSTPDQMAHEFYCPAWNTHIYTSVEAQVLTPENTPLLTTVSPDAPYYSQNSIYYNFKAAKSLDLSLFTLPVDPSTCKYVSRMPDDDKKNEKRVYSFDFLKKQ